MNHGKLLKIIRTSKSISQQDLSHGISSQAALSRMEMSGNIPSHLLISYLQRLDVHPTEFFMIAENSTFIDSQDFFKDFELAVNDYEKMIALYKEKIELYNTSGLLRHKINAYAVKAVYCYIHKIPLDDSENISLTIRQYLLNLDNWFISDIILYTQVIFLFDSEIIKLQHSKMLKSLNTLPFSLSWQYTNAMNYLHSTVLLSFKRNNMNDVAFYLNSFKDNLSEDVKTMVDTIYYYLYKDLLDLKIDFTNSKYNLLCEQIKIFNKYGYEKEYFKSLEFINTILEKNLI